MGPRTNQPTRRGAALLGVAMMLTVFTAGPAMAQQATDAPYLDSGVVPAGCASCQSGLLGPPVLPGPGHGGVMYDDLGGLVDIVPLPGGDCGGCGGPACEANCFPGRQPCVEAGPCGGFLHRIHDCMCCPDPCYEPRWVPAANAALFVDHARPRSMMRIRWDGGRNLILPDRNAYFWGAIGGAGPRNPEARVDYDDLSLYMETAVDNFSFFIETYYRNIDPVVNPGAASFGDLNIGTKSLLMDCELMQATFQFVTQIPTGPSGRGIGRGLVALEPSLLTSVKLWEDAYTQGQISEWIPLGGNRDIAGSMLHYHFSYNQVVYRPLPDVDIIGVGEFGGYAFQAGGFTDPFGNVQPSNGDGYFYLAPGVRTSVCNKLDIGFGVRLMLGNEHFAEDLYRLELRWLY